MEDFFMALVIASGVGIWYFIKKRPDKNKRNLSILLLIISFVAFGMIYKPNEEKAAESKNSSSSLVEDNDVPNETSESTESSADKKAREEAEAAELEKKAEEEEKAKQQAEEEAQKKKAEEEAAAKAKEEENAAKLATRSKSGTGDNVTDALQLDAGYTIFNLRNDGSRNFIVKLYDENGNKIDTLSNEIGAYQGNIGILINNPGNYTLEVASSGNWSISANQEMPTTGEEGSISGRGDDVKFINLQSGSYKVTGTHNGERNFIARANDQATLFNEIGNYTGTKIQKVNDNSIYAISVQADGDWTITFEK